MTAVGPQYSGESGFQPATQVAQHFSLGQKTTIVESTHVYTITLTISFNSIVEQRQESGCDGSKEESGSSPAFLFETSHLPALPTCVKTIAGRDKEMLVLKVQ